MVSGQRKPPVVSVAPLPRDGAVNAGDVARLVGTVRTSDGVAVTGADPGGSGVDVVGRCKSKSLDR